MNKSKCPCCGGDAVNWVRDGWGVITCHKCRIHFNALAISREGRRFKWEMKRNEQALL